MFKAYEDSAVASRLLTQMSFADSLTGRGELRLQETLGNILKSYFVIDIRRKNVLVDALDQVWRREKRELIRPLKVRMGMDEGEEGVDHGGVQQEFFRIAITEAFNPDYGLFTVIDEQTQMVWFRPCSREPLYKYGLIGLLFGLAIYNGLTLPVNFPLAFYWKLKGNEATTTRQIKDGWPMLAKGLQSLLDWSDGDVADVFARTYEFIVETPGQNIAVDMQRIRRDDDSWMPEHLDPHPNICPLCSQFGSGTHVVRVRDHQGLTPPPSSSASSASEEKCEVHVRTGLEDAATIKLSAKRPRMVTNENREQYVEDYIFWLTDKSIQPQFRAFADAFFTCISDKAPSLFDVKDFKQFVEGTKDVDVNDLRKIASYDGGYTPEHQTIQDFWRTVEEFSPEQIGLLLEFVTASDRLPITGVSNISFSVQKNGEGDERLPTSLTCYGRLLLPAYTSRAVLKEKLCLAIENSKGFGVP
ncbi:MAG: hypothetical protein Q9166_000095 [cf. Caloplaca sp. 2 TL-2023]